MKNLARSLLLLSILSIATSVIGVGDKLVYLNTDCSTNGDGTSQVCGTNGPYNTCANAITGEVAANANLTTLGGNLLISAQGTAPDGPCSISGFTGVDASHLVRLTGDFSGTTWNTAKYRISSSVNGTFGLTVAIPNFEVFHTQVEHTGFGSGTYAGLASTTGAKSIKAGYNLFRVADCQGPGGGGGNCWAAVWQPPSVSGNTNIFYNNIIISSPTSTKSSEALRLNSGNNSEVNIIYNNSIYGGQNCIETNGGGTGDSEYIKNNVCNGQWGTAYNLDTGGSFTTAKVTANNISGDTSSPDGASFRSKTCTFTDVSTRGAENLSLQFADTNCKENGASLASDPSSQLNIADDILGTLRPQITNYDIGANEVTPTPTPTATPTATPTPTAVPTSVVRKGQRCTMSGKGRCGKNF